jgi:predicted transcriptional regulator
MAYSPDIGPEDETSSTSLILTAKLKKQLREFAIQKQRSQSEIARVAIAKYLHG